MRRTSQKQQRLFLQVSWEALEDAGYAPRSGTPHATTGVFAACGIDGYMLRHLGANGSNPLVHDPLDPAGIWLAETGNEKDYIATRVAYQVTTKTGAFSLFHSPATHSSPRHVHSHFSST